MNNFAHAQFDGPVELVKDIFDVAARQERSTALQLVRVCKAARCWVNPILYETVELDNPSAVRFESMLTMENNSLEAPPSLVKNLYATCLPNAEILSSRCTGLRAITLANYDVPRLHRLSLPSLTHLTVCGTLRSAHLSPRMPVLRTITHLRFANDVPRLVPEFAEAIPRLTHFACSYWLNKATQHRELEDCLKTVLSAPALRVALVFLEENNAEIAQRVSDVINAIRDPRLVITADRNLITKRDGPLSTDDTLWRFAEHTLASRSAFDRSAYLS